MRDTLAVHSTLHSTNIQYNVALVLLVYFVVCFGHSQDFRAYPGSLIEFKKQRDNYVIMYIRQKTARII